MTSADAVALAQQSISAGSPPMGGGLHRWWDTASQSPPSPPPPVTRLVTPLALHASIPWWWRNAVVRLPPPPPRTVRRGCWRARNKDTAWQLRQGGPPRPPPLSVEPTSPRLPPPHARAWCTVGGGCRRVWSLAARARAASTHPPACLLQGGGPPLAGGLAAASLAGVCQPTPACAAVLCGAVVEGGGGARRGTWPRLLRARVRVGTGGALATPACCARWRVRRIARGVRSQPALAAGAARFGPAVDCATQRPQRARPPPPLTPAACLHHRRRRRCHRRRCHHHHRGLPARLSGLSPWHHHRPCRYHRRSSGLPLGTVVTCAQPAAHVRACLTPALPVVLVLPARVIKHAIRRCGLCLLARLPIPPSPLTFAVSLPAHLDVIFFAQLAAPPPPWPSTLAGYGVCLVS